MRTGRRRCTRLALAATLGALCPLAATPSGAGAEVTPEPYGANDAGYPNAGFRNVLPAGENGLDNALELAEFETKKTYPPHYRDQLPLYADLCTPRRR